MSLATTPRRLTGSVRRASWIGMGAVLVFLAAQPLWADEPDYSFITGLNRYELGVLTTGGEYYSDRDYTITSMPAELEGTVGIITANDDKAQTSETWITFTLTRATNVYVAYDKRASSRPDWMSSYTDTGLGLGVTDAGASPMNVFVKSFEAGEVVLGANSAPGASGQGTGYIVLFLPVSSFFLFHPYARPIEVGGHVTLAVGLVEPNPAATYQWQKNSSDILDAHSTSYHIGPAIYEDEGNYRCVVDDGNGKTECFSNETYLEVLAPGSLPAAGPAALVLLAIGLMGAALRRS